jgi:hypothetical protein
MGCFSWSRSGNKKCLLVNWWIGGYGLVVIPNGQLKNSSREEGQVE